MTSVFRSFLISVCVVFAVAMFRPSLHAQGLGGFSAIGIGGLTEEEESDTPTEITANSADIDLKNKVITLIGNVKVDSDKDTITCDKMEIYLEEDAAETLVGTAEKPEEINEGKQVNPKTAETGDGKDSADGDASEDENEEDEKKKIKKIVCIGNVVFKKPAEQDDPDGQDQIAISGNAEFDVQKEIVVMTGAHSDPAKVLPEGIYESMEKHVRGSIIANCPVMMQGETWIIGDSFTIFIKENNRMKVKDMKFHYTGTSFLTTDTEDEEEEEKDDKTVTDAMISAKDADIDLENNRIVLTGNVDVDEESNKITCNKMVITLTEKESAGDEPEKETETAAASNEIGGGKDVSKIVCTGDVVFLKRGAADSSADEDQIAMSEKADYDAVKEILDMTGNPVMMQGSNRLYGSRIKVFLKEDNRMEVDTAKAQLAGKLLSSDDDTPGLAVTAITAKRADIRQNDKITLSQNVVVDDGTGQITCGKMEIFMRKDSSNSLFDISNAPERSTGDGKGNNELGNDVSRIICTGNVVYRKQADEGSGKQIVLAREAHYDASTEEIEMIGAHSSPQGEIPRDAYDEIVRALGKNGANGNSSDGETVFDEYSIMMQDSNWIAGSPIKIFPKEGNRISVKYMKAGLRQTSRSTASGEEKN